jgi:hypothetical protein
MGDTFFLIWGGVVNVHQVNVFESQPECIQGDIQQPATAQHSHTFDPGAGERTGYEIPRFFQVVSPLFRFSQVPVHNAFLVPDVAHAPEDF